METLLDEAVGGADSDDPLSFQGLSTGHRPNRVRLVLALATALQFAENGDLDGLLHRIYRIAREADALAAEARRIGVLDEKSAPDCSEAPF
jgi:hypothetical protein